MTVSSTSASHIYSGSGHCRPDADRFGSPQITGAIAFNAGTHTISGSGSDIWGRSKQFHFNSGTLAGYGTVTACVKTTGNTNIWAKSGAMLRNDGAPDSAFVDLVVTSHDAAPLSVRTFSNIAVTPDTDTRYLHTQANEMRDLYIHFATLRGVNIGGQLVTEGWICGQSDNPGRSASEDLQAPFGLAQASTLIKTWWDNWFTDRDMDNLPSRAFARAAIRRLTGGRKTDS